MDTGFEVNPKIGLIKMRLRNILLYLLMVASIAPIGAGRLIDDLTIDHDAGRMTVGLYGEGDDLASNANRFSEGMEYDAHGNVTSIVRYGKISSSGYGLRPGGFAICPH